MRLLQSILLVIGAPALGVMVCGLGLASLLVATAFRTRPGQDPSLDWGAAGAFLLCGVCGGACGAVVGLVLAVRWLNRHGRKRWPAATWVGVGLGLAVALAIHSSGVLGRYVPGDVIRWRPGFVCFLAASATLGGLVGGAVGTRQGRPGRLNHDD